MGNDKYAPGKKHTTHILCDRELLDQEIGRNCPEEISKIEDSSYPRVFLSFKSKIGDEGIGGGII